MGEAGFFRDIRESTVVVVVVEMTRESFAGRQAVQFRAVHNENIGPAIVVEVEDGNAGACGFDDVFLRVFAAENDRRCNSGFLRDIGKMRERLGIGVLGAIISGHL